MRRLESRASKKSYRLDIFCQFFDNFFFWFIRNFGLNTQLPHFSLWFLEV